MATNDPNAPTPQDGAPSPGAPADHTPIIPARTDTTPEPASEPASRVSEPASGSPLPPNPAPAAPEDVAARPASAEDRPAPPPPPPAPPRKAPRGRKSVKSKPVDPKKRPSRSARHPAVVIGSGVFTFLLFLAVGGGLAAWYGQMKYSAPGPLTAEKTVLIPRGSGGRDIAEILEREGVVDNWALFVASQQITRRGEVLKAGEYVFPPHVSIAEVLDQMVAGKVVQHQVTIPEGLTSLQVVDRLMANDLLSGTPRMPQEGTLLPETYNVVRGMRRDELIARMTADQQKVVKELWEKRAPDLPLKSPQDMVILASIVEKETGKPEERPRVAAVFINRLNRKMRLQSDPTIIYGIVGGKGTLGRPISKTDITTATPYNTYAIDGLPPGPIANPGREALAAVANPAKSKDLYFVADGTGGHVFAETLDQHNRNVARWREIEADARQRASQGGNGTAPGTGTGTAPATPAQRAPASAN
ncbi:endolytic transglycosylase MltG [Aquabacter sp. L1I39]|uniref:endolytic transglycosylase MltG n=1 Tax=Aquabacter sp. L1I39 TaxID=2820278 RepID=UPI001ADBAE6E|nr:endolytic transglycosylase MltG [Aquabacter sp. L1I39]QTL04581.1 endolytic transglycosylase MltG [Aquabacter sp. L1I39]